ncbi:hypothetical protein DACRYDRAFT_95672 [Dacryopinax primogenitus]|uniref:Uncharacterized protein n=1 Tax=Dacryopinax primogenitus (strain DJM 731) TaxID=1858805 RepID=M5FXF8_DACPD|nr:uncharacterized protein DACRYDRAFT_95672 [Dacryopinax primogenitus]EJU00470.1 hypothetical protein DACRYDRAFT_95672 [Dacryopinax primogenitus]
MSDDFGTLEDHGYVFSLHPENPRNAAISEYARIIAERNKDKYKGWHAAVIPEVSLWLEDVHDTSMESMLVLMLNCSINVE